MKKKNVLKAVANDDGCMLDEFLDCNGQTRVFRLGGHPNPLFFEAVELRDGEPVGQRFVIRVNPDHGPPWGEMREKIREWLSRRDLVRDRKGQLQMLHRKIRAQISSREDVDTGDPVPSLLVDDMEIGWSELGRLLTTYEGWGLQIEVCDPSER